MQQSQQPDTAGHTKPTGNGGKLEGTLPAYFKGDRNKAAQFAAEWQLYWNINHHTKSMKNPFKRVSVALTRIRGLKVDHWVLQQIDELKENECLYGKRDELL